MAAADGNFRQALHAALDRMCDQLSRNLDAERDKNNRFLGQLLRLVKSGESVEQLLEKQLSGSHHETMEQSAAALQMVQPQANPPSLDLFPASSAESNQLVALKAELSNLQRRFNALSANFSIAKEAIQERTSSRDKWVRHASYLEKIIADAEQKHGVKIIYSKSRAPAATPKEHGPSPAPIPDTRPDDFQDASAGNEQRSALDVPAESTQGDSEEEQQLPQLPRQQPCDVVSAQPASEHLSDIPVVVLERPVRKRRRNDSDPIAVKARVKAEPLDESSLISAIRSTSDTQQSLDLGDIAKKIVTPRKRKELAIPDSGYVSIASDPAIPLLKRFAVAATPGKPLYRTAHNRKGSVLTPLSVNVRAPAPDATDFKARRPRRGTAHAISAVAEDGDVYRAHSPIARKQGVSSASPSNKGRLDMLLNSPSPAVNGSVLGRSADRRHADPEPRLPIPQRRELPFEKSSAQKSHLRSGLAGPPAYATPNRARPAPQKDGTRPAPQKDGSAASSLRKKPLSELRLEDFKINPQANDGYNFAFTEVVRDKAERTCLPGCTDAHCCGKQFAALARSQRPDPPLTPAQRVQEQKLLEEYLGEAAHRLASMTGPERADLWVEAKAHELANKYGKHRQRFSRPQSPPGFWNADFPSTQELVLDRAEAARRERLVVAERHREATRPGGRWLFKDE
ncbi:hypothetical protein XA68_10322 [Ophiocordyceps unilateralis]|uniref:DNA endonuclease activator Ctp1 C-terminal domain-containing protein n=1 Tax=Ophiocordyceps unilateralis TaxID=268505 RepID=A0A2A9PHI9_OPHUN|nr:hypothetical protein XA68_10322 [Ophiocordyceps unilateralis]